MSIYLYRMYLYIKSSICKTEVNRKLAAVNYCMLLCLTCNIENNGLGKIKGGPSILL